MTMPTLENRLSALEARTSPCDSVETILISFFTPSDGGPRVVQPAAIKETFGAWRLERAAGEDLEVLRDRAISLCPRERGRMQSLIEVAA
jgi:hypothetical protein